LISTRGFDLALYGYAESPGFAVSTAKRTKDTTRDFKFICSAFVFFVVK